MFSLTRCHPDRFVCVHVFIRLRGSTWTNQIAPLIARLIGGLIIIRAAWWEVNIRQLRERQQNNKEEAARGYSPADNLFGAGDGTNSHWPRSVFRRNTSEYWILLKKHLGVALIFWTLCSTSRCQERPERHAAGESTQTWQNHSVKTPVVDLIHCKIWW